MNTELSQIDLATELGISDRRIRQLEEKGVVVRNTRGNYDVDRNRRRYRLFIDRDMERVANEVEEAAERAADVLDQMRAEPDLSTRRLLVQRLGSTVGELDSAMKLANALAPDSSRALLDSYTNMVVGRLTSELFDLCNWQIAGE
jgi:hypothetical protein